MKNIKRTLTIGVALIAILGVVAVSYYIYGDRQFIKSDETKLLSVQQSKVATSDDIKIGLIGDSWVAKEKLDSLIETNLKSKGVTVEVASSGHPGAKSKSILKNLMTPSDSNNPTKNILEDKGISHVIVIAGVNDTVGHIGSDFYSHHMKEIVKILNANEKTPIILEVPEVGIEEPEQFKSSVKHAMYRILFDGNKTDVTSAYRETLSRELKETNLNYELIPYPEKIDDYHENLNLYNDQFHLNEDGNEILSTHISEYLYKIINN